MQSSVLFHLHRYRFLLIGILFFVILGWELVKFAEPMLKPCPATSDIALIETQIYFAKKCQEFTGVYSRYQFHHPGPIQFYWNAWMEWISPFTDNTLGKHHFSNWVLNKIFLIIAFSFFLHSMRSVRSGWFYGLVFILLYSSLFMSGIHELNYTIWNPANTIAPVFAFLFSYPYLKKGNWFALFLLPIVTQFAFQNHVGVAILIAPMTLYAFYRIYHYVEIDRKIFILYLLFYATLSLLLFSPSIYQEFMDEEGNISKLFHFITKNGGIKKSLWKTLSFIGSLYTGVYSEQSVLTKNLSGLLLTILLFLIAFYRFQERMWKEWKSNFWFGISITLYASLGMKGPFIEFGIWFYYSLVFLSVLLAIKSLEEIFSIYWGAKVFSLLGVRWRISYFFLAIVISWLGAVTFFGDLLHKNQVICDTTERKELNYLLDHFRKKETRIRFSLPFNEMHGDRWPHLAGLVNGLNARGVEVCVSEEWDFMFQRSLRCARWKGDAEILTVEVRNKKNFLEEGGRRETWGWSGEMGGMLLLARE